MRWPQSVEGCVPAVVVAAVMQVDVRISVLVRRRNHKHIVIVDVRAFCSGTSVDCSDAFAVAVGRGGRAAPRARRRPRHTIAAAPQIPAAAAAEAEAEAIARNAGQLALENQAGQEGTERVEAERLLGIAVERGAQIISTGTRKQRYPEVVPIWSSFVSERGLLHSWLLSTLSVTHAHCFGEQSVVKAWRGRQERMREREKWMGWAHLTEITPRSRLRIHGRVRHVWPPVDPALSTSRHMYSSKSVLVSTVPVLECRSSCVGAPIQ